MAAKKRARKATKKRARKSPAKRARKSRSRTLPRVRTYHSKHATYTLTRHPKKSSGKSRKGRGRKRK